ncbi:MAG TPA: 2-succinyl-5-enolpyruvyl-6-hydroxy-3-cyclohexene-1-carboxylic-acid synthase, partial [Candidatus Thermoplasmatota archaeon]|nr:2-succinyl-5-enolpyruvyl-6-hydroxy-3-cyclohexene-1-carboxylic-acid synthase [Candidatus Thermoplasmatota archaeon]
MNRNLWWATGIVRTLHRLGVARFVLSPGSRSAPLALAVHGEGVPASVVLDERAAAYMAVGHARATAAPAAVVTTSGTAVANLLPAAVEASESGLPMVLLTADRPTGLRGVGANQAIDQVGIFGRHVRSAVDLPLPQPGDRFGEKLVQELERLLEEGLDGPVHLNVPFEEPLDARPVPEDEALLRRTAAWRPPRRAEAVPRPLRLDALQGLPAARQPLVVVGPWRADEATLRAVRQLAEALDAPLLADPLSGLRYGNPACVSAYDAFLRDPVLPAPDLVLRFGDAPTSKPLLRYLGALQARHVVVGRARRHHGLPAAHVLDAQPLRVAETAARLAQPAREGWRDEWLARDASVRERLRPPAATGGAVARAMHDALPAGATWWLGSSLPVRDADLFVPASAKRLDAMGNRGASGIDGVVAAAAGAACARPEAPAALLVGDLSLQHDVGSLAAVAEHAPHLAIVCVNNGGGQVFRHLDVARTTDAAAFRRLFETPQRFDIAGAAAAFG